VDFNQAIGAGLRKAAMSLLMLQFYFLFFCSEGIARRHFQWHKNTVALLHKHLYWVRFIIVPAVFLIHTTTASQYYEYGDTLGRLSLIVMELAIGFFMIKLAHPNHGLWERWLSEGKTHWLLNFRYLLYILVIIIPMIIMGFAAAGYYLSALELQEKLINTLRLFMLTVIAHELLFRCLSLINRQLATKNEQLSALGSYNTKTPQIDINKINAQTRKFMRVMLTFVVTLGFWVIWKNILPAFSFLDHMVLWQHKAIIDNQESYQPITLTNLLLAILYFL
jgi:potassium efflux system protein